MKQLRSEVFEQTYQDYLQQIREIDYLAKADLLGLERRDTRLRIPLYHQLYWFTDEGLSRDGGGDISVPLRVILCKYLLRCTSPPTGANRLQPYREFKDAAPLISHFATTTTSHLEKAFSGKLSLFHSSCEGLGGERLESEVYDLSYKFYALPRIPVVLNFNDTDDLFPAGCSILYNSTAEAYLDMECLSMTGTHLAALLTQSLAV